MASGCDQCVWVVGMVAGHGWTKHGSIGHKLDVIGSPTAGIAAWDGVMDGSTRYIRLCVSSTPMLNYF